MTKLMPRPRFSQPHLLGVGALSRADIDGLLQRAEAWFAWNRRASKADKAGAPLRGRTLINLFFETSTRTQSSFEIAGKRLGANVMSMHVAVSSVRKGETLLDTASTLNAMRPDLLVVRHASSGAVALLARKLSCAVINAGDGTHEHPSQALLDALTIKRHCGRVRGLTVAMCGDIVHSRVARSNLRLLHTLGNQVRLVGPPTLLPPQPPLEGVRCFTDMAEGLKGCDIIMPLRLQTERMDGAFIPSMREYYHLYGLTPDKLACAKPNALIMHPGPMNRGIEIDSSLADHPTRSLISEQVEAGVAMRMAILEALGQPRPAARTGTGARGRARKSA